MKYNIFFIILALTIISFTSYSAIMVGNPPGFPEKNKFSIGVKTWDFSNIEMEYDDNVQDEFSLVGRGIMASYGLSDILALDVMYGQADFENIYDEGTVWGLGARALIYESPDGFKFMGGFRYNKYDLDEAQSGIFIFRAEPNSSVASIDISKMFADRLTIYAGIDYAYMKFKYYHNGDFGEREGGYEQIDEFGYYAGADFRIIDGFSFFAEKHFANEEAYVLGMLYKFSGKDIATTEKTPSAPPEDKGIFGWQKFHAGVEFSRFTDRKMVEEGGYVPQYSNYRMASDRLFAVLSYDLIDRITVYTKFGNADLETHSSEGETTEFDSEIALGIGSRVKLIEVGKNAWITGDVSYLSYSPEDEKTVSTAKHAFKTPGDVSIEWSELLLSADISKRVDKTMIFAGVEYINVNADQDRLLDDGSVVSSSFEADQNVGIYAGFQYWLTESLSVFFRTDLITERQYTFGGSVSF